MITPKELSAVAAKYKLKDTQVEKDYVLSWILYGISKNELLFKNLAFKGGTVLKKIYFEDYRFSEDLDFTLLDEKITNEGLLKEFEKVYAFAKQEANISIKLKEHGEHESGSLVFYVNYAGPLQANIDSRDIKIDITRGEVLEFEIETKPLIITYSDLPSDSFSLKCYALPEVLVEKMAAMMGRTEPRDLYDFWYLTEHDGLKPKDYKGEFERKATNKKHIPAQLEEKVIAKERNFKKDWARKLENQMNDLPKFDDVFRESKRNLKF
ncbi:MAG: nucleotidyl transferase AbiEii/AbiGii toxin family protein [Bacteroidota bacterium]